MKNILGYNKIIIYIGVRPVVLYRYTIILLYMAYGNKKNDSGTIASVGGIVAAQYYTILHIIIIMLLMLF